jgi:uncharacterized membrane protein YoaK (UPF0700 family)
MKARFRVLPVFAFLVGVACATFVIARTWQAFRSSDADDATRALVIIVPIVVAGVLLLVRWRPSLRVASVIVPATILALCTLASTAFAYRSIDPQKWASSSWISFAFAVVCYGASGLLSLAVTAIVFHGSRRFISSVIAPEHDI